MGGKSLMKKILIVILMLINSLQANLSVDQIKEMVSKIHEKRVGIDIDTLETTKEPFVKEQIENNVTIFVAPKEEETKLSLHSIMNGKAFINNEWKSVDNVIMGYTLKHIGKKGVVLRNGNRIKKLFLHKKRDNFIKTKER